MKTEELKFLMPLLDDDDETVYIAVRKKLIEEGITYLPFLERALDSANSLLQNDRLESIILEIKMMKTRKDLMKWAQSENKSLLLGWILASSIQDSEFLSSDTEKLVYKLVQQVWLEFNNSQTSIEKLSVINQIFYQHYGFRIITSGASSPEYYFIDKVLKSKRGNNLSINMLYAVIARQLNMMLVPVVLNDKIYLAYHNPVLSREAFGEIIHPFLFFVDVGHEGKIISVREFDYLLRDLDMKWSTKLVLDNICLMQRYFMEINNIYRDSGYGEKVKYTEQIINSLKNVE